MADPSTRLFYVAGTLVLLYVVWFILARELVCWYWKVNEIAGLLRNVDKTLESIDNRLESIDSRLASIDSMYPTVTCPACDHSFHAAAAEKVAEPNVYACPSCQQRLKL